MDEKLVEFFGKWIKAFESVQAATKEKDLVAAHKAISQLQSQIAATPAEGLRGLVVKLGLHQFLNEHADAASLQVDSAYADLDSSFRGLASGCGRPTTVLFYSD